MMMNDILFVFHHLYLVSVNYPKQNGLAQALREIGRIE